MKEKFLKFYEKHQHTCEIAIVGAGFGIITAALVFKMQGMEVTGADLWNRDEDDLKMITVLHKNGTTTDLQFNLKT